MPATTRNTPRKAAASKAGATTDATPPTAMKRTTRATAASTGYTMADVAKHDTDGDAWVSVGDKVYDISQWVRRHPGGSIPLLQYAGRDMTDAFRAYHGGAGYTLKSS
jgi:cytochrome b involved in lipid metabolism